MFTNKETIDTVSRLYAEDIAAFEYTFETEKQAKSKKSFGSLLKGLKKPKKQKSGPGTAANDEATERPAKRPKAAVQSEHETQSPGQNTKAAAEE